MNHYCTLFDSFYLTRGLALYESLLAHEKQFLLHVFCFDDQSFQLLKKLNLKHLHPIARQEFESPELLSVKPSRTIAEYCWTSTPVILRHILKTIPAIDAITYLDADLYFYASAEPLFAEMAAANGSILITEHRYSPGFDQSKESGIYCVQFVTFKNDTWGRTALDWWHDRCIEWCFARTEDGKFGDQMYLDDWPTRFKGVCVLQNRAGGVAPWNVQQYQVTNGPLVDGKKLVFYHFHALRAFANGEYDASHYPITNAVCELIYLPYLDALERALHLVRAINPSFAAGLVEKPIDMRSRLKRLKRRLKGTLKLLRAPTNSNIAR